MMQTKNAKKLQVTITVISAIFLLIHIFVPNITIDAITITLLVIAIVPWLYPLFKSVEIPGVGKVEFQDYLIEKVERDLTKANLLDPEFKGGGGNLPYLTFLELSIETISHKELAAKIKTEIEKTLLQILPDYTNIKAGDITSQLRLLTLADLISEQKRNAILEYVSLLDLIQELDQRPNSDSLLRVLEIGQILVHVLEDIPMKNFRG